eukprot:CAMPEP_0197047666 /NCGR_PEP_ID=MMETSP1384-20130603/23126_1 /TAXON_ID=29189 /ORGANISM="Ammonia sp." /LENGTH=306 /DNA_ID=CAMNT_0042479637 /DNA_START=243 /DNA_END=1163 /DNA_ORIENTATION=-
MTTEGELNSALSSPLPSLGDTSHSRLNEEIPAWRALLSGAAAGVSVDISLYPIDTIKTRLQSAQGFWKSGGFKGVYRGLSAAASGSAPGAALFFVTYESSKPFIHHRVLGSKEAMNNNPLTHMMAAATGETAACLIRVPTEVIKQRMQTGGYDRLSVALTHTFKSYGIRGFYAGYLTTVAREIPFSFIQFPLWERLKILCCNYFNDGQEIKPYQGALCGSISGGIAAAVTTPLDVIKTRLMLRVDANNVPYRGFVDCAKRVYIENGAQTFFKGVVPRVSWIFVGGFFFFGAYEKTKQLTKCLQSES